METTSALERPEMMQEFRANAIEGLEELNKKNVRGWAVKIIIRAI